MSKIVHQPDFMARLNHGLIRTNKFEVVIFTPQALGLDPYTGEGMRVFCKSIKESPSKLGVLENVYRMGRQVKYAGDREFENMTATFYGTEETRDYFLRWSNKIDNFFTGYMDDRIRTPMDYMGVLQITSFDPHGNRFRNLKREYPNIFPVNVSGMDLDHGAQNQADIFSVEFAINYTDIEGFTNTGNMGGGRNNQFYEGDVLTGNAGNFA